MNHPAPKKRLPTSGSAGKAEKPHYAKHKPTTKGFIEMKAFVVHGPPDTDPDNTGCEEDSY